MNEKEIIRKHFSELGKRGSDKFTPEERSERARKAVNARWEKYRQKLSTD